MPPDHHLERFVSAQEPVFANVADELSAGKKLTHWMWFIFPQLAELGRSERARFYGIKGLDEARAYLAHPLLGQRLRQCVRLVLRHENMSAHDIFGSPDDMKFRSCLTLFREASADSGDSDLFDAGLNAFYGAPDPLTLDLLGA
ncbi:MAG: DUF1810 domain-containing protein [Tepidamorphaceae bacterium]